jgi:hypothetical protein
MTKTNRNCQEATKLMSSNPTLITPADDDPAVVVVQTAPAATPPTPPPPAPVYHFDRRDVPMPMQIGGCIVLTVIMLLLAGVLFMGYTSLQNSNSAKKGVADLKNRLGEGEASNGNLGNDGESENFEGDGTFPTPPPSNGGNGGNEGFAGQGDGSSNSSGNNGEANGNCHVRDLGPWAPTGNLGETFEITGSDQGSDTQSSAGVVVGLWWPAGNAPWGLQEITTIVPRGLSVSVEKAAGRGWDYEQVCGVSAVYTEASRHGSERKNDTSYFGFVDIDDLIDMGLVEIRHDRRPR